MSSLPLDNLSQLAPVELVPGTCRSPIKDDPVNATFQYHLDHGRNDEQTVRPRTDDTRNDPSQDDNQSGSADTNRSGSSEPQNEDHDDTAAESEPVISQNESEGQPSVGLSDPILAVFPPTIKFGSTVVWPAMPIVSTWSTRSPWKKTIRIRISMRTSLI